MNPRSLAPVLGQWHLNSLAWIEVRPHAWQPLSWVWMRPDLLLVVLGAGDKDPDLSALSATLKTKLGL